MKRISRRIPSITALILGLGGLVQGPATAGPVQGRLMVGITIVDACSLAVPQGQNDPLASLTGFGLRCAKGTTYSITQAGTDPQQADGDAQGLRRVILRF